MKLIYRKLITVVTSLALISGMVYITAFAADGEQQNGTIKSSTEAITQQQYNNFTGNKFSANKDATTQITGTIDLVVEGGQDFWYLVFKPGTPDGTFTFAGHYSNDGCSVTTITVKGPITESLRYYIQNGGGHNGSVNHIKLGGFVKDPEPTPTPEVTPTPTPEITPSPTPEITPSPTPEATPTPTPEATPTPTPEITPSPTPEITPTPTPEITPSPTPEVTPTPTPEITPSPTPESTPGNNEEDDESFDYDNLEVALGAPEVPEEPVIIPSDPPVERPEGIVEAYFEVDEEEIALGEPEMPKTGVGANPWMMGLLVSAAATLFFAIKRERSNKA